MRDLPPLPVYDRLRSYEWNYDHPPHPVPLDLPPMPGVWQFCGLPVGAPLGVPAGPLLNGRWWLYYASLGFDELTYKTVRSRPRECYPLPNLQPVRCGQLHGGEQDLPACDAMDETWAVANGMPSQPPAVWQSDIQWTRDRLDSAKVLSVSVVGTMQADWTIDDLAADYAWCARAAVDSGADVVETNFSCPNVATCDGQLYQHAADASHCAAAVRDAIGTTPYLVKIGHVESAEGADRLLAALAPFVDGLVMTNSIAATVVDQRGERLFDGQKRGICGGAIRDASLAQTRLFGQRLPNAGEPLQLIGVGGVFTAAHVRAYLDAGATAVHVATAAMTHPDVALAIRDAWDGT